MRLTVTKNRYDIDIKSLEKVAGAAFSLLPEKEGDIELIFVGKSKIRQINQTYRGIDKVTDVLSFNIGEKPFIGQIFICYNRSKEQASRLGKELDEELALLLVHGLLHLYDYDHEADDQAAEMENKEKLILSKLGISR